MQRLVISASQWDSEDSIYLTPTQRHYLLNVLRLQEGDRLIVLDGCGQGWLAALESKDCLELLEPYQFKTELPVSVHLVAALPKHGFDEVVRCCTELGVASIQPIISARTILKPSANKLKRWQKIATEAAEQSERAWVPIIHDPRRFKDYVQHSVEPEHNHYLCAARAGTQHICKAIATHPETSSISIALGPEGGWTEPEINQAIAQGMRVVSLGRSILRAVTASITAVSLVNGVLCLREPERQG